MSLKADLLKQFSLHPGEYLNGEQLAKQFSVSRAAVWKAVKALKKDGFEILSSSVLGYCASVRNDFLSAEVIQAVAPEITAPVHIFEEIDSTNNYARVLAAQNAVSGTLVLANSQTAGRGRQGHSFYSPRRSGLYFSMILRPENMKHIFRLTPAAAVSAADAIEELTGIRAGIKWVNDLFIEKKKIGGILTEAITDFETGKIESVIIGIGINIRETDFPDEIRNIAGTLNAGAVSRSALAAILRRNLMTNARHLDEDDIMNRYRDLSIVLNREITYSINNELQTGFVQDINSEGSLVLRDENGNTVILQSGEISIKNW
ncbi:MAG: biotin--[acetyl-CoA-carboxylase] ligase [Solobacterium sp.]|nr:biotin--[acetyl-CoA-carboxylase] ligase [Solobacterium sp.]